MDTKPPTSLPSLKLMESANRLMKQAETMDDKEIDELMDSFPNAGYERRWEIIAIMFILVVNHPMPSDESVYGHLKELLAGANSKAHKKEGRGQ